MCKNKVEDKCCGKECESKKAAKQAAKEAPIVFDMKRMQDALAGESTLIPNGLTSEEVRQFILKKAEEGK